MVWRGPLPFRKLVGGGVDENCFCPISRLGPVPTLVHTSEDIPDELGAWDYHRGEERIGGFLTAGFICEVCSARIPLVEGVRILGRKLMPLVFEIERLLNFVFQRFEGAGLLQRSFDT